jgi:hypothetical protein
MPRVKENTSSEDSTSVERATGTIMKKKANGRHGSLLSLTHTKQWSQNREHMQVQQCIETKHTYLSAGEYCAGGSSPPGDASFSCC